MRSLLTVACLLASTALVLGQGGVLTPPPMTPAADPALENILQAWEKTMSGVKSMVADCTRTRLDKTLGGSEVFEGKAKFIRSEVAGHPSRASLEMRMKTKPDIFEKYVFTGTFLYEYRPTSKVIVVHQIPPAKDGLGDDNVLGFIFGMKADAVKKRYHLAAIPPPPKDEWYHYVKIQPRFDADKAEFSEARLVLVRSTGLPRQFWFRQPNGDEITWDFPRIDNGAAVPIIEFAMPKLPDGWKWEREKDLAPRVMRNIGK